MPLLQSRCCRRCRSSQFRRSHTKNLIERAVRFAIVPVRCQYCGHRRYNSRWTVSQLGKTTVGAPHWGGGTFLLARLCVIGVWIFQVFRRWQLSQPSLLLDSGHLDATVHRRRRWQFSHGIFNS